MFPKSQGKYVAEIEAYADSDRQGNKVGRSLEQAHLVIFFEFRNEPISCLLKKANCGWLHSLSVKVYSCPYQSVAGLNRPNKFVKLRPKTLVYNVTGLNQLTAG